MHEFFAGNKDAVTTSSEGRVAEQTDDGRKYASNDRRTDGDGPPAKQ